MSKQPKGYIRVGHLVYMIIIAVIILSFFLVMAFGDKETANTTIGTASTVSSLILSVIAILMSLIDVTGQRESMVDLKETSEKLHETNENAVSLVEDLMERLKDLQDMKDQMLEAVAGSETWKNEFIEKLEELKSKGNIEAKDLEQIMKDVTAQKYIENVIAVIPNYKKSDDSSRKVFHYLLENMRGRFKNNEARYSEVIRDLQEHGDLPLSAARSLVNLWESKGYVERFKGDGPGLYIRFKFNE